MPARGGRGDRTPHDSSDDAGRSPVSALAGMKKAKAQEDFRGSDENGDNDENNDDPSLVWRA